MSEYELGANLGQWVFAHCPAQNDTAASCGRFHIKVAEHACQISTLLSRQHTHTVVLSSFADLVSAAAKIDYDKGIKMFWVIFAVVSIVAILIFQANDRKKNPQKWADIDEAEVRRKKHKQEREYQEAMKRVAPSVWMRMSKHEKADVLARREKAARERP